MKIYYGPPGTGKTTKLIDVVEEEIKRGTPISRIAYVSFSKKATVEAQVRLSSKLGFTLKEAPHFRTLHSMAFRAVRASTQQMMDISKYVDFGKKSGFSLKGYYSPEEGMSSRDDDFIMVEQLYRNNRKYSEKALNDIDHARFVTFMTMYVKYKQTFNYLDFTDLLDLYIEQGHIEDVDVAILDEAQDFTTLQWNVILHAFKDAKRIYIAGDDDQCIYQWSGADIDIFLKLRGEATILDHSHRLPASILRKAKGITSLIMHRVSKEYTPRLEEGKVTTLDSLDELEITENESTYLLARNNYLLSQYVQYCVNRHIPFLLKGKPFVTDSEIQAVSMNMDKDIDENKVEYIRNVWPLIEDPSNIKVNISTIHAVKGGEAEHVVLLSDITKGVAKQLSIDEDSEHRVFYVGITRARSKLSVILPTSKYHYPYL